MELLVLVHSLQSVVPHSISYRDKEISNTELIRTASPVLNTMSVYFSGHLTNQDSAFSSTLYVCLD